MATRDHTGRAGEITPRPRTLPKGTVENTNGRVRRWLPRDVDPKTLTTRQIIAICHDLNATPRKCLGYRTPAEVFREKLMTEADTLP